MRDSDGYNVFNVNDFDKARMDLYVFDVRRMAVSILLAASENQLSSDAQDIVLYFLDNFVNGLKDPSNTYEFRLDSTNTHGVVYDLIQKVAGKDRSSLLIKDTMINSTGNRVFQITSELQPVSSDTYATISAAMINYIDSIVYYEQNYEAGYYDVKDICQKFGSGIGSLGKYRYFVLIEGPSSATDDDRILEMKQETSARIVTDSAHDLSRDRTAGSTTFNNLQFFVREKSPFQKDFDYTKLTTKTEFMEAMGYVGKIVAYYYWTSASDISVAIGDKEAEFKNEIVSFALDYANQVEYDYQSFLDALYRRVPLY